MGRRMREAGFIMLRLLALREHFSKLFILVFFFTLPCHWRDSQQTLRLAPGEVCVTAESC